VEPYSGHYLRKVLNQRKTLVDRSEMICPRCCEEREAGAFLNENPLCYRCVYNEKSAKYGRKASVNYCKICDNVCSEHRWVYCSRECAEIGELKQKRDYWTFKVKNL